MASPALKPLAFPMAQPRDSLLMVNRMLRQSGLRSRLLELGTDLGGFAPVDLVASDLLTSDRS